jgi:hypothetical protein
MNVTSMACITPNDPRFKELLAKVRNPLLAELEHDKEMSLGTSDVAQVKKNIADNLPPAVANVVNVVEYVPLDIKGNTDIQMSMQSLLEDTDIKDPLLINWLGVNRATVDAKTVKSTNQLDSIIKNSYNQKIKQSKPLLKQDAKVQFEKWENGLEEYPLPFKDAILKYAIKNLINPKRTNKFVISFSEIALNNVYRDVINQPHKLNQVGTIYNSELLKLTSDATEHEPSASGRGYWVHVPRTDTGKKLGYYSYEEVVNEIKKLEELVNKAEELKSKTPVFYSQEPNLNRADANRYGFQDYSYIRVESTYSRWTRRDKPHAKILGEDYEGYYIHGYNTEVGKPDTRILPITKEQAEELYKKEVEKYPQSAYEVDDRQILYNLKFNTDRLNSLKKEFEGLKPEDWGKQVEQFKANAELLRKLSPQTWCTASSMAEHYVENYDNYILVVDGKTVAGIEAKSEIKFQSTIDNLNKSIQLANENREKLIVERNNKFYIHIPPPNIGSSFSSEGRSVYAVRDSKEEAIALFNKQFGEQFNSYIVSKEEEIRKLSTNKRQVKEVTSIANNGIAPIDHLDDIIAFFEKHNLDTNNESINNAIRARNKGNTDEDLFDESYEPEGPYNPYGDGYDMDGYPEDPYDYDPDQEAYERERMEAEAEEIDRLTNLQEPEEAIEFLRNARFNLFNRMYVELRSDERVAEVAIEKDSHNITFVPQDLPFYKELAHKAVIANPAVFNYISDEAKAEQRNIDLHERHLEEVRNIAALDDLPFSQTKDSRIQGYYDPKTDKVVVVASNTPVEEGAQVAIHEVAHRGMVRMAKELGGTQELYEALSAAKTQLMKKLPELLKRTGHKNLEDLMLDYGFDPSSKDGELKLLSELAARWAETLVGKPKPSWWKRFLQSIKNWIKQFTGKVLSENQVDELVGGFVKYGTAKDKKLSDKEIQFSKKEKPTQEVKPEVKELFESNPELADAVYEALGFNPKMITRDGQEYFNNPRIRFFVKIADEVRASLPKLKEGYTRLYRGNRPSDLKSNPQFTNSLEGIALPFLMSYEGQLSYIDIPTSDLSKYVQKGGVATNAEFIVTPEIAKTATPINNSIVEKYKQQYPDKFAPIEIIPQQKQQAQQLYSQYLDTIKSNVILPTDKIVFGHPTIGKSFLKNQGEDKFISLDDDYATEINSKVKEIADKYNVTTYQVKDGGTQKWNNEYNQMMQEMFNVAKQRAISENKTLFTSNTNLLRNNAESFDKVINLTDKEFERRIQERGAKYDIKEWKSQINETISKLPTNKVINTEKYLSDLFLGSKQDIEGFKEFVETRPAVIPKSEYSYLLDEPATPNSSVSNKIDMSKDYQNLEKMYKSLTFEERIKLGSLEDIIAARSNWPEEFIIDWINCNK